MNTFRILLLALFINIIVYTLATVSTVGWDLFSPFLGAIQAMNWSGQFNVDFSSYLLLSALWVAWRNHFSAKGIGLALLAAVLGILFFAPYLLWLSYQKQGKIEAVLLAE